MSKPLPTKYVSEDAVKRALKIDSFRNLSKEKVMQFASMIPYVDREVAIAIINQFPVFADFGRLAISQYSNICQRILENNNEGYRATVQGYQTILDALAKRMEGDISDDERKSLTIDMITVADKIADADIQNKKFHERIIMKIGGFLLAAGALIGAGIGVASQFGGNNNLPELPENENGEDENEHDKDIY